MNQGRKTRAEWKGSNPIFVLKINWHGLTYYLSTFPKIIDSSAGTIVLNGGMLEDPEFNSTLSSLGFDVSSFSTPIAGYLRNVDMGEQYKNGNTLEDADAELSFLLVDSDGNCENFDNRTVLVTGKIKEPLIGHREKFRGYFEASIEVPVSEESLHASSMGQLARISKEEMSDLVAPSNGPLATILDAFGRVKVLEMHKEKVLPIIFGIVGPFLDDENTFQQLSGTPVYVLFAEQVGTNVSIYFVIAPHPIKAQRIRIYDENGSFFLGDVQTWVRADGRVFSFVERTQTTSSGFINPLDNEEAKYYGSFLSLYGGGLISPATNSELTGAGDVCIFCLEQGGQPVDYVAWDALRPFLNTYKIAGFINNQEISSIQFLTDEILPLLPLSIVQGKSGMRPILDLFTSGFKPTPVCSIVASPEFSASSPIQIRGDTSNIVNDITVNYCFDLNKGTYKARQRISGNTNLISPTISSNKLAISSFHKYGARNKNIETKFVTDIDTAALIALDTINYFAFLPNFIDYLAAPSYGWLEIGDIISLTDTNLSIINQNVQVVAKEWTGTLFKLSLKLSIRGLHD